MAARRVAKVGIDVGYKMGDGVGAFWRHAINTEPIAVYSVVLATIGNILTLGWRAISGMTSFVCQESLLRTSAPRSPRLKGLERLRH